MEETRIMVKLDHPNIVKLLEVFEDDGSYYLVNEYFEGISSLLTY
jgi:calcium-dependent protein kinase